MVCVLVCLWLFLFQPHCCRNPDNLVHWAAVIDREIKPDYSYTVFNAVVGGFRQALCVQQTRALETSEDKVDAEEIKSNVNGALFIALFRMLKLAHRSSPAPILSGNLDIVSELQSLVCCGRSRYNHELEKAIIELVR